MIPVTVTTGANHSGVLHIIGYSFQETGSAAAVVEFRKAVVGGQILAYLNLIADSSATIFFPKSMASEGGVYVKLVSGAVSGVLYKY